MAIWIVKRINIICFSAILPLAILMMAVLIGSLVWAYQDAEKRGKSGWLVVFLVLLCNWPFSLLI